MLELHKKRGSPQMYSARSHGLEVIKSNQFAYSEKGKRNLTLEGLQQAFCNSLSKANLQDNPLTQGFSIHLMLGKGDWKFKREWLQMSRRWSCRDRVCPRCFASALPAADKPWCDPVHERFNNEADIAQAMDTGVGGSIALRQVRGWHPASEWSDLLHTFYLGIARDAVTSLIMDLAEHFGPCRQYSTWDEKLQVVLEDFQEWAVRNGIRASTVDELSHCEHQ